MELVAAEKQGPFRSVTFLGSVKYDALKKVFENRVIMALFLPTFHVSFRFIFCSFFLMCVKRRSDTKLFHVKSV